MHYKVIPTQPHPGLGIASFIISLAGGTGQVPLLLLAGLLGTQSVRIEKAFSG